MNMTIKPQIKLKKMITSLHSKRKMKNEVKRKNFYHDMILYTLLINIRL